MQTYVVEIVKDNETVYAFLINADSELAAKEKAQLRYPLHDGETYSCSIQPDSVAP